MKVLVALMTLGLASASASEAVRLAGDMADILRNKEVQKYIDQMTLELEGNVSTYFKGISLNNYQLKCKGSTRYNLDFEVINMSYQNGVSQKNCHRTVQLGECPEAGQYSLGEGEKKVRFIGDQLVCK